MPNYVKENGMITIELQKGVELSKIVERIKQEFPKFKVTVKKGKAVINRGDIVFHFEMFNNYLNVKLERINIIPGGGLLGWAMLEGYKKIMKSEKNVEDFEKTLYTKIYEEFGMK